MSRFQRLVRRLGGCHPSLAVPSLAVPSLAVLCLASACVTETPAASTTSGGSAVKVTPPTTPVVELQAASPVAGQSSAKPRGGQDIIAQIITKAVGKDGPLDPATYTYVWKLVDIDSRHEVVVEDLVEQVVPGDRVVKGQKWTVEVTAVDNLVESKAARATATIENGRPYAGSVSLTRDPSMPSAYYVPGQGIGSLLLDLYDPDKDDVSVRFVWHRLRAGADREMGQETLTFPGTQRTKPKTGSYFPDSRQLQDGDQVRVVAVPTDTEGASGDEVASPWYPVADALVLDKVKGVGSTGKPVSFEFSPVSAGSFVMGAADADVVSDAASRPTFKATLTQNFLIARTETTIAQWLAISGDDGVDRTVDELAAPATELSWTQAADFCNKLSAALKVLPAAYTATYDLVPGAPGFRLPTEAQWEYAARAGLSGADYGDAVDDVAWYNPPAQASCAATSACKTGAICFKTDEAAAAGVCAPRCDPAAETPCALAGYTCETAVDGFTSACIAPVTSASSHPVARKQGNAWRLYDVLGNAWEWTSDWFWGYSAMPLVDPVGPQSGLVLRVARGGGFGSPGVSFAMRRPLSPDEVPETLDVGFRVLRPLP